MISNISVKDLLDLPSGINIIDIRSNQNYNNNHIPGSINIPFEKLLIEPNKYLKIGTRYYLYCQKGITSSKLSRILNTKGYKTTNVTGGYEEWIMKS